MITKFKAKYNEFFDYWNAASQDTDHNLYASYLKQWKTIFVLFILICLISNGFFELCKMRKKNRKTTHFSFLIYLRIFSILLVSISVETKIVSSVFSFCCLNNWNSSLLYIVLLLMSFVSHVSVQQYRVYIFDIEVWIQTLFPPNR